MGLELLGSPIIPVHMCIAAVHYVLLGAGINRWRFLLK